MPFKVRCEADVWRCLGCGRTVAQGFVSTGKSCPKCPAGTAYQKCTKTDPTPGHPGGCELRVKHADAKCWLHGGSTTQAKAGVARRDRAQRAEVVVARLAVPVVGTDHIGALQDALDLSHGVLNVLAGLVNGLHLEVMDDTGETAGIAGRTYHQSGIATGEAKPHIFVVMLNEERDRYARLSIECAKLGIAERHAQVEEAKIAVLADVLRTVFDDPELGMTAEQRQTATTVTERHLRVLDATSA
jgi:hypothetical protein